MEAYDIETFIDNNSQHRPYCVCYSFKKEFFFIYFNNEDIVLDSLKSIFEKNKNEMFFYVHNLNFDGLLILNTLSKNNEFLFTTFIKKLQIYAISIEFKEKKIHFRCSYKILPSSLKSIASSFNIEKKLPFPYKFSNLTNLYYKGELPDYSYFNSKEDWDQMHKEKMFDFREYSIKYCTRDVEITKKFIKILHDLVKDFRINFNKVFSAPSLSLKIFIKKFNKNRVSFRHNFLSDKLIRSAYFGGRCEVYGNPKEGENLVHFDFSGMYAQCMKQNFPFGKYYINNSCKKIDRPGFYWIKYKSKNEIPILPHHRETDNKLVFTNGELCGCYWYEEIILFLEKGGIVEDVLYCIYFENYSNIFEEFIEYFDKIRGLGNEYKTFSKLMVNSLYGRLGMDYIDTHSFFIKKNELENYEKSIDIISHTNLNDITLLEAEINDKLIKKLKINFQRTKSNVAIAAAITSKARIKLYTAQQSVILNKGRLLYSDTDSIFAAYNYNPIDQKHGEIFWDSNKKDTLIHDAVFINPKTYALLYPDGKEVIKMKGYNQKEINFDEIKKNFYKNKDININNYRFMEKNKLLLLEKISEKKFNISKYDKRKFVLNKKETKAYTYKNGKYL